MSLVHRQDQVGPNVVALACHSCGQRYGREEFEDFELLGDPLQCECGAGGMIPHRASRMDERFPAPLASRYTPLPEALMDHAAALGLGPHELLVVWALERHRRTVGDEVYPSRETLSALTQLSEGQLKRATRRLDSAGLIRRRQPHFVRSGRKANSRYDLDPLWDAIASLERGEPTVGHQRPAEVDVEKADAEGNESPDGRERRFATARGELPSQLDDTFGPNPFAFR